MIELKHKCLSFTKIVSSTQNRKEKAQIADKLAEKDNTIAEKDAEIARLKAMLNN